jgi:hypothetical protein
MPLTCTNAISQRMASVDPGSVVPTFEEAPVCAAYDRPQVVEFRPAPAADGDGAVDPGR